MLGNDLTVGQTKTHGGSWGYMQRVYELRRGGWASWQPGRDRHVYKWGLCPSLAGWVQWIEVTETSKAAREGVHPGDPAATSVLTCGCSTALPAGWLRWFEATWASNFARRGGPPDNPAATGVLTCRSSAPLQQAGYGGLRRQGPPSLREGAGLPATWQ